MAREVVISQQRRMKMVMMVYKKANGLRNTKKLDKLSMNGDK